jgi:hypothetical protein
LLAREMKAHRSLSKVDVAAMETVAVSHVTILLGR